PWMMTVFRLLAKLKGLRGTAFDPFGYSEERRTERALIADYEALLAEVLERLTPENHHLAVALAAIPDKIRGLGHIKLRSLTAGTQAALCGAAPRSRRRWHQRGAGRHAFRCRCARGLHRGRSDRGASQGAGRARRHPQPDRADPRRHARGSRRRGNRDRAAVSL